MEPEKRHAACASLYDHWRSGSLLDELPPDLRPADRAEAYQVQSRIEEYSGRPLKGWKIAATSSAGQAHIGVDGPMAGRLLAERAIPDGGTCVLGSNLMKVAEMEFAFRMGEDMLPRAEPYTQTEVLSRVSALHPAIELPDSRYQHFERVGALQLIADNACAHYFVLGAAAPETWRSLDLAQYKVHALKNGAVAVSGQGANVLGDPRLALTWLVNELSQFGYALRKDQVVMTGTCVKPMPIGMGDRVEGDFGQLGRVSVEIT
ncbi:MAG TPA: fumarylacetoacetate hydrolase family protein [Rhizomicrobium sp.]|jgi:2-keto-4-pentenoate hydratase|nr:fumarylacetoacetate hydrolase family protein [Rhizomicrobium sp.]